MGELEQLYEDVLGFFEDHDSELEDVIERQAFMIVIRVLAGYAILDDDLDETILICNCKEFPCEHTKGENN